MAEGIEDRAGGRVVTRGDVEGAAVQRHAELGRQREDRLEALQHRPHLAQLADALPAGADAGVDAGAAVRHPLHLALQVAQPGSHGKKLLAHHADAVRAVEELGVVLVHEGLKLGVERADLVRHGHVRGHQVPQPGSERWDVKSGEYVRRG